jgi:hypothetical protein
MTEPAAEVAPDPSNPPVAPENTGIGFTPAPAEAGGETPAGDPASPAPDAWDGPDWVSDKYRGAENPIEAQAQAYSEAMKKFATKTEDLRGVVEGEVRETVEAEVREAWAKERGAPEDASAYEYPAEFTAPGEDIDTGFRGWAKKHELSQEAFNEAVQLFGQTQVDPAAERALLGDNADARIAAMNAWGTQMIPEGLHEAASQVMNTAAGFELVEHFMTANRDTGYSPTGGVAPTPLTREDIRAKMNDPRYHDPVKKDDAYVASVTKLWQDFATRNG